MLFSAVTFVAIYYAALDKAQVLLQGQNTCAISSSQAKITVSSQDG